MIAFLEENKILNHKPVSNGVKKILLLSIGLIFLAASCDLSSGLFDFSGAGVRGVFKSYDGGEAFTAVNALSKGDISGITTNTLIFGNNTSVLYIGSSTGIFKTEDSAKTWKFILSGINVADMAVDTGANNVVYAAGISGQSGKIIKSLDGGVSWVDLYTEPSKNNAVLSIAVSQVNPAVVVAGLGSGEIIRSFDSGHTWQAVKDLSERIVKIRFGSGNNVYALTTRSGLNKSADAGFTWNKISTQLTTEALSSAGQSPVSVSVFDDLALDKRQGGVVYLGTDQGLFRTVNDGVSWAFVSLPVKNASLRISAVGVDPRNSNNIFVGIGSTLFKSTNGGVTWQTKVLQKNTEVRVILIDQLNPSVIYLGMGVTRQ